jgi:hypothetical protein
MSRRPKSMSDNSSAYYPPAAGYGLYLLLRTLYRAAKPAAPARSGRPPIITPPPGSSTPVSPVEQVPNSRATLALAWPIPDAAPLVVPVEKWQRKGELVAWRFWGLGRLSADGGVRLKSFRAPWVWDGPVLSAHRLPSESPFGRAGVYALRAPPPRRADVHWSEECWLSGWVALSGRVVEHEHGYRAERAVIRRLRLGVGTHLRVTRMEDLLALANELERRYQAPVNLGHVERRFAGRVLKNQEHLWRPEIPVIPGWVRVG